MTREEKYILIDLERTLGTGIVHFWKQTKFGYTSVPGEAGKFSLNEASHEVTQDHDNQTVSFPENQFQKILKKYGFLEI